MLTQGRPRLVNTLAPILSENSDPALAEIPMDTLLMQALPQTFDEWRGVTPSEKPNPGMTPPVLVQ